MCEHIKQKKIVVCLFHSVFMPESETKRVSDKARPTWPPVSKRARNITAKAGGCGRQVGG